MNCRRHGRKPTIALWMLVALADVALLAAAGGLVATVLIAVSLAVVVAGGFAARRMVSARSRDVVARRRA